MTANTDDLRITATKELRSPSELIQAVPVSAAAAQTVTGVRSDVHNILAGTDSRLVVIVGPCSIHDPEAAVEYASQLVTLRE